MAHAIWSGAINFGLVTIPVKLYTAVRDNDLSFNQLHAKDQGRINYKRVCSKDGKEVPWAEIVKGYEVEKDQYVIIEGAERKAIAPEATQSIDIAQFVSLSEIDPMLFDRPYYLEPEKKSQHAYALLRDALSKAGKVGIATVVIRTKQYLAALRPHGDALVLDLMRFADEVVPADDFKFPGDIKVAAGEMKMANMLIDSMTSPFKADEYEDTYRHQVMAMIEARAKGKPAKKGKAPAKPAATVVNLMDVLQQSLNETAKRKKVSSNGHSKNGKTAAKTKDRVKAAR